MNDQEMSKMFGEQNMIFMKGFLELSKRIPSIDEIVAQPDTAKIPEDYVAIGILLQMMVDASTKENVSAYIQYMERMPSRWYTAILFRDVYRKIGGQLSGNAAWASWFSRNKSMFDVDEPVGKDYETVRYLDLRNRLERIEAAIMVKGKKARS